MTVSEHDQDTPVSHTHTHTLCTQSQCVYMQASFLTLMDPHIARLWVDFQEHVKTHARRTAADQVSTLIMLIHPSAFFNVHARVPHLFQSEEAPGFRAPPRQRPRARFPTSGHPGGVPALDP